MSGNSLAFEAFYRVYVLVCVCVSTLVYRLIRKGKIEFAFAHQNPQRHARAFSDRRTIFIKKIERVVRTRHAFIVQAMLLFRFLSSHAIFFVFRVANRPFFMTFSSIFPSSKVEHCLFERFWLHFYYRLCDCFIFFSIIRSVLLFSVVGYSSFSLFAMSTATHKPLQMCWILSICFAVRHAFAYFPLRRHQINHMQLT